MTQTPAGWYPDPTSEARQQRYWDGSAWTNHVSQAAVTIVGPTTPDGVPLAGWWSRVAAYLLDSMVIGTVSSVLTLPGQMAMQNDLNSLAGPSVAQQPTGEAVLSEIIGVIQANLWWMMLPAVLAGTAYFVLMWRFFGATVGMFALGLRVRLRERPGRLGWSAVGLRIAIWSAGSVPVMLGIATGSWTATLVLAVVGSVFGWANVLWPLWDPHRQAIHDKVAATNVVQAR